MFIYSPCPLVRPLHVDNHLASHWTAAPGSDMQSATTTHWLVRAACSHGELWAASTPATTRLLEDKPGMLHLNMRPTIGQQHCNLTGQYKLDRTQIFGEGFSAKFWKLTAGYDAARYDVY